MDTKICSACGMEKPISGFYKQGTGYTAKCRSCISDYRKQFQARNTEQARLRRAENRDEYNAYMREYRSKHADELRQADRERYWSNEERRRSHHPKRKDDPAYQERRRVWKERRRAAANGIDADLSPEEWRCILADFDHRCAYCGSSRDITQDHFVPLSKGGSHTASNIVPACRSCNCSKHDDLPQDWLPQDTYNRISLYLTRSLQGGPLR